MNVVLYRPEDFTVDKLSKDAAPLYDFICYLPHAISYGLIHNRDYREQGKVPLKAEYVRNIVGRQRWKRVRDIALDVGLITTRNQYRVGKHSRYYAIGPSWGKLTTHYPTNRFLIGNIERWRQRQNQKTVDRAEAFGRGHLLPHLVRSLHRMSIHPADIPALVAGSGKSYHPSAVRTFEMEHRAIENGDVFYKFDNYGRFHTNLTNLWTPLRSYLRADNGEQLVQVDIGTSQPLFVGISISGANPANQTATLYDVNFLRDAETGVLYNRLAAAVSDTTDRETAKRRCLRILYQDSNKPYFREEKWTMAFANLYPRTHGFICDEKRDDYRDLARRIQRVESDFIFNRVIDRILTERPSLFVATIHDSVVTTEGNDDYVCAVMRNEFNELGVSPKLKTEHFSSQQEPTQLAA